jgi:hypothetical protein
MFIKRFFYLYLLLFVVFHCHFFAEDFSRVDMDAYFKYINSTRQSVFDKANKALFKVTIKKENLTRKVKCSELVDHWFCAIKGKKEYDAQVEKTIEALGIAITVADSKDTFFIIFEPLEDVNRDIDVVIGDCTYKCSFVGYDDMTEMSLYKVPAEQQDAFYRNVKPLQLSNEFKNGAYSFVIESGLPCKKEEKVYVKDLNYTNTFCDCNSAPLSLFLNQKVELVGVSTGKSVFKEFYVRHLSYDMSEDYSSDERYGVITVDEIRKVVSALLNDGVVRRSCGGLTLFSVNKKLAEERQLKVEYGCYVDSSSFDSNFVVKPGDVIISVNNHKVKSFGDFFSLFKVYKNADLKLTLYRADEKIDNVVIDAGVNADVPFVYEKGNKLKIEGISFVEATSNDGITSSVMISAVDNEKLTKSFEWEKNSNFVVKSVNTHSVCSLSELKKVFLNSFKESSNKDKNVPLTLIGSFPGKDSNEKIFSLLLAKRE